MEEVKEHIIARAVRNYDDHLKVDDLLPLLEIDEDLFYEHFDSVDDVWRESYRLFVSQAESGMDTIDGLKSADIQERLATFIFVLLDVLESNEEFSKRTFRKYASGFSTPFQESVRSVTADIVESRDVPGVNRVIFQNRAALFVISESLVQLVGVWQADDSTQKERSSALIDRYISFWAEIIASGVPERTVDLLRYSIEADYLPIKNLPFIRDFFPDEPDRQERETG